MSDEAAASTVAGVTSIAGPPLHENSAAAGDPGPRRARKRPLRKMTVVALLAAGLASSGFGVFAVAHELTRAPTKAELAAAGRAEVAQRWRQLRAGQIFPAAISYQMREDDAVTGQARLIGIAPQAACTAAASGAIASALRTHHCQTVLRATYADASGTMLATIGVAVMPTPAAAFTAADDIAGSTQAIRPVGFAGTISQGFAPSGVLYAQANAGGPYVVMDASGYTDGRGTGDSTLPANPLFFADQLATRVLNSLTRQIPPCFAADVTC
jgi:hypothetical protein